MNESMTALTWTKAEGRKILAEVPGVREVVVGESLHANTRFRRAWLVRLASAEAGVASMRNAVHLDYAERIFRPHGGGLCAGLNGILALGGGCGMCPPAEPELSLVVWKCGSRLVKLAPAGRRCKLKGSLPKLRTTRRVHVR